MKTYTLRIVLAGLLQLAATYRASAGEKGWFGFSTAVRLSGIFNPTVGSVTVEAVEPKSPAAEKAIAAGDEIIQLENTDVAGHKVSELKPLMQKQVGESLHLKLKRADGSIYSVTLVAAKPRG